MLNLWSSCLHFSSTGITGAMGACSYAWFIEIETRASCMLGGHTTNWTTVAARGWDVRDHLWPLCKFEGNLGYLKDGKGKRGRGGGREGGKTNRWKLKANVSQEWISRHLSSQDRDKLWDIEIWFVRILSIPSIIGTKARKELCECGRGLAAEWKHFAAEIRDGYLSVWKAPAEDDPPCMW